jgi:cell division protein FtsL
MKNKKISLLYLPLPIIFLPKVKFSLDRKLIINLVFLFILPLLVFYIFQVGKLIETNYYLSSQRKFIEKTNLEINELEKGILKNYSLKDLEEKAFSLGFKNIDKVNYISMPAQYLAQKTEKY